MIDFSITIITQTKNHLNEFKSKIEGIKSNLFSNFHSVHSECDTLIMYLKSHISTANSERELCDHCMSENYRNISLIELEISSLKYELNQIPNTEENSGAIKALNQEIKDYRSLISIIRNKNRNLESIKTQIGFEIDKFSSAINKIETAKKKFDEIHYKVSNSLSNALRLVDEGIKITEKAYNTVNGIFTSCTIENSNVLVSYRNKLVSVYQSFTQERYKILNNLNNLNDSIKNIEFLETSSTNMKNITNSIEYHITEFEKSHSLLNKYINTLKTYESI